MSKPFIFGTATASYQVEGAAAEGGRSPSIWDTFCAVPGRVENGDSGAVACDQFHRYREDVALMRQLGVDSYRFSIAWPRIYPAQGQYNPQGMAYYKALIAELAAAGIAPAITLYHWDLPQWAQDKGGWENRDCVNWYLEYAARCFVELDAENVMWITHNEPWCAAFLGNLTGEHAPGNTDAEKALRAAHHLLLSHGAAVQHYLDKGGRGEIGITLNMAPVYVESAGFADNLAGAMQNGYQNRWFMDPLFRKSYPADLAALFAVRTGTDFDFVKPGDFEVIAAPCDFLGLNFYSRSFVKYDPTALLLNRGAHSTLPKTDMGWDICPETLGDLLREMRGYTDLPVYITENGSAWPDEVAPDGAVHDAGRVDYLLAHLAEVEALNAEGLDIAGYYAWSLLDNFEWAWGYGKRFGIVRVDYDTQKRTPKDSYYAYQRYIRERRGG